MIYTLNYRSRIGLWELRMDNLRIRYYTTRDAAMKTVTRYRRATQTIYDREEQIALEQEWGYFREADHD